MSGVLVRHDSILESAVAKHGGRVFKKVGDAVCAAFERTSSAARAALEAQLQLSGEDFGELGPLAVRMALHTGEAEERGDDYFGPALNRVARLLSAGYGQQVLVSSTSASLLDSDRSNSCELVSLGVHHLKDMAEPEEIFQLCAPGLRRDFPRLRAIEAVPTNLPLRLTSFVGRDDDIRKLRDTLNHERLVTLVGPGGVGKTRLAVELGADQIDRYVDGVWLVELASITEAELVGEVLASTLGIRGATGRSAINSILAAIAKKQLLLILDNCEHVIDTIAHLVDQILKTCPGVRCIATSREALRIGGEAVHEVASLSVPDEPQESSSESQRFGAIRLFCERAKENVHGFTLTDGNAPLVTEICRRLDGIPFAIELTAAQLPLLSLEHVNERLKDRLPLVAGRGRAVLPRHMTMESLIDWSYGLLQEPEAKMFRTVGTFSGTFSLPASAACCGDPGSSNEVLALLSRLVEQSLLFVDTSSETERYRLLETTRQYALTKLRENGEFETAAKLHADFFRRVVRDADLQFHLTPHELWFTRLLVELDNIRGLLSWAFSETGDFALAADVIGSLDRFWFEAGLIHEAQRWIERAMNLMSEAEAPAIVARLWLARALFLAGDAKLAAAERARAIYESIKDDHAVAYALREVGLALRQVGRRQQAHQALTQAVSLLEHEDDPGGLSMALNTLGASYAYENEFDAARKTYSKALAVARNANAQYATMMAYLHLADLEFLSGDCEGAAGLAVEALRLAQGQMNSRFYANVKCNLAAYRIGLNQFDLADQDAREALRIIKRNQDSFQVANVVLHLAFLAAQRNDAARAARLVGYSDAYLAEHGLEREATEHWVRDRTLDAVSQQLPAETVASMLHLGGMISEERAIHDALEDAAKP